MIRFIGALAALLLSTGAVAQTFPSPTYNNATINGLLNGQPVGALSLSGDCTASGTFTATATCLKTNGTPFSAAATTAIGTSGATIPLLSTANTWSATQMLPFVTMTTAGSAIYSGGGMTASNNYNLKIPSSDLFILQDSSNGIGLVYGGNTAAITGRANITPGQGNNPVAFSTGNSSYSPTGFAFQPGALGSVHFFESGLTGTPTPQPSNPYNCNGVWGIVSICNNTDTLNAVSTTAPASLNIARILGGAGTTGGRFGLDVTLNLVAGTSDATNIFYQAANIIAVASAPMGGTSGNPLGHLFAGSSQSRAEGGATNLWSVDNWEDDISIDSGASAKFLGGRSVVLLSSNSVAPSIEGWGFLVSSQASTPTIDCGYCLIGYEGFNPFSTSAAVMAFHPNAYSGPGSSMAWGDDFRLGTFSNAAFSDFGGDIFNNGGLHSGNLLISTTGGVTTFDPTGSSATTATVSTPGSSYIISASRNLEDADGGVWEIATLSGSGVATVTNLRPPFVTGTPPTTLSLSSKGGQPGTGAVITPSWSTGTAITMNGVDILGGAGTTVSALPACNTALRGGRTFVTDATSPTFLGTLTGGGTVVTPVFCNATAWVPG